MRRHRLRCASFYPQNRVEQQQPHLEIRVVFLEPAGMGGSQNEYAARIKVVAYIVDLYDTMSIQNITYDKGVYGKQIL